MATPEWGGWIERLLGWRRTRHVDLEQTAPLRAELFSADQMEQHARELARLHGEATDGFRDDLLERLDANERALLSACELVTTAVRAESRITPAGEWLLDNFHLIEEQIRTARQHLPKGYSRELPRLAHGVSIGLPRVYVLALEVISHGDGRIDAETLSRFIAAYQNIHPLTLGELWAIPIMLRLALIENLRRVGVRISADRIHLNQARDWANRMIEVADRDPKSLILVIADMTRSQPPMASAFVAELSRRLQGLGPSLALPLTWIEQRLSESSLTIEALVLAESQTQAADQVSISNSIGSLRFLAAMDWRDFVEAMSGVEQVLSRDPAGVYRKMDFATRDQYRHVIDELAKHCALSEIAVAEAAIALAQAATEAAAEALHSHRTHVGYFLIDRGLPVLEQRVQLRLPRSTRLRRVIAGYPRTLYLGALLLLTGGFTGLALQPALTAGLAGWPLAILALLLALVASQLAAALTNHAATLLVAPRRLPRMDYAGGIPAEQRTLVVVPTLLLHAENVDELLAALEVRHLGNRQVQLHFALLTDFADASLATLPNDEALLARAAAGIAALNAKYPGDNSRFLLLHRPRRWNPVEGVWMGHERKRGKLADLNAVLRGHGRDRFELILGDLAGLAPIRYVITLDTDTQLPRDAARLMIGAMAHPLNRPRFDPGRNCVHAGYGILQPRVAASLVGSQRSRYARLCSAETGIDPYTRSVSDVYQDLFGEGSYIGKGIYDVDAFERALATRLPANRILSHDLLEGCHVRSGLLSDVEVHEDHPARHAADVSRQERWIRGDWQIAQWLLPWVPGFDAGRLRNPLSALSRAKILDNLRRSLVPLALLLLLIGGWALLPDAGGYTLALLAVFWLPPLLSALVAAFRKTAGMSVAAHATEVLRAARRGLAVAGLRLACLPHEAGYTLVAILRTVWRMLWSRRRLLEWQVSQSVRWPGVEATRIIDVYRRLWVVPSTALLALGLIGPQPAALLPAAPVLLLWLLTPALIWWLDRPAGRREDRLSEEQHRFLRQVARRTWAYFERYVGVDDHHLPPDNFQLEPGPVLAHRTSPTNIGLALLANLSAHDFGYLGVGGLLGRCADTLATMDALPRHQGHFYNWYDTRTLQALPPRYISAVDSGNLAGHLLTLRAGLLALASQPALSSRLFDGLADTFGVCRELAGNAPPAPMAALAAALDAALAVPCRQLSQVLLLLAPIRAAAATLAEATATSTDADLAWWTEALWRQCEDAHRELLWLAPWLQLGPAPAGSELTELLVERPGGTVGLPTLAELSRQAAQRVSAIDARVARSPTAAERLWLAELRAHAQHCIDRCAERIAMCRELAQQADDFATLEWAFLYDATRHLLAVGYNVDQFRRDTSYYDLLASEARLGCFVAIARGQLPQESWFALGRLLTSAGGDALLVSWSGSMFEYLMPQLVMPNYSGTLLDQTCRAAVARQIDYGRQRDLPWGVSESGYYAFDASRNYQYHAFGVPGLGLKRGLGDDAVVAPYASVLALMVAPAAACANLQRLAADRMLGPCGFFEAVDYTPERQRHGESPPIVRSFMAHHQGMSLLALASLLLQQPMQRRFASDPEVQATLLLLQERIPKLSPLKFRASAHAGGNGVVEATAMDPAAPMAAHTASPEVQLLSNGRYHVMVTNAGGGSSRWKDLAVTRWREDRSCDPWGSFIYLRDVDSGEFWSAALQPTGKHADHYEATFSEGRAEFRRVDHQIESHCEIVVSPEDDIELRRLRLTNRADRSRRIELTSYCEVVLTTPAAEQLHPGFANLFVQTEIIGGRRSVLCTRRPRSRDEATPWMFHLLGTNGSSVGPASYETDRMRFIGRGRSPASPRAMLEAGALSGTAGSVLDPIAAIRTEVSLAPGQTLTLDLVTGAAPSREACLALVDKYQDRHLADRVLELAATHGSVNLRQINATDADAQCYRRLAGAVLYANAALRAHATVLLQNRRGQSGLWGYAISGDLPIVLLTVADSANLNLVRQMVRCHSYWRLKGLAVDLVIWNEDHIGYRQRLQDQISALIATGTGANSVDRPGGIYVRCAEQIASEDRILLQTVARVVLSDTRGSLAEQLLVLGSAPKCLPRLQPTTRHRAARPPPEAPLGGLQQANGTGGFGAEGREYVIRVGPDRQTPLPWVNVLANPRFGTVLTESGLSYSFADNAHEFRLTPWSDDPVGASGGEAIYLRDEDSGHVWSPTPQPCPDRAGYGIRHGFGYSVFEHEVDGLRSELTVFVDDRDAVKYSVLEVHNHSGRKRRLSATGYVEWVLGDLRSRTAMHVITSIDRNSGALFAHNAYNTEFADHVAFFDVDDLLRTLTGDRTEFLGRNGSLARPDALTRTRLSGRLGAALDPCGAIQVPFELADGQSREIIFRLGVGRSPDEARELALRLRRPGTAAAALERVRLHWAQTLDAVSIETPDVAVNLLANGWLVYQTLASRLWARSGYSQSGGAWGFRDQLQDVMALLHATPGLAREHLLRCAARQYAEGDVQHWWHPPHGRGVRTRCSDDYLWLPLALCRYVQVTGDHAVLDEQLPFLEGRPLAADEESYYDLPTRTEERVSLHQHAVRALRHGLRFGRHGLPLMGSGDWNDGMNRVGIGGHGESVWLGFFLYDVLTRYGALAEQVGDPEVAALCRTQAQTLRENLDRHGWDGDWYRRAWFDDGTPLGSAQSAECRIDSISQSWSVLSGGGDPARAQRAMEMVDQHLVRRKAGLIQLLDPPFDTADVDPGYIKGYVPGVRENGGQYTHAAVWAAMAFARLGDAPRAWELLSLINPLNHADSPEAVAVYQAEPYVLAADVYARAPHVGRGGWTWYTGSAGWLYRLITESLLGLQREGASLWIRPCIPADWPGYALNYRHGRSRYRIEVTQRDAAEPGGARLFVDGIEQADGRIPLIDDGSAHRVELVINRARPPVTSGLVEAAAVVAIATDSTILMP